MDFFKNRSISLWLYLPGSCPNALQFVTSNVFVGNYKTSHQWHYIAKINAQQIVIDWIEYALWMWNQKRGVARKKRNENSNRLFLKATQTDTRIQENHLTIHINHFLFYLSRFPEEWFQLTTIFPIVYRLNWKQALLPFWQQNWLDLIGVYNFLTSNMQQVSS